MHLRSPSLSSLALGLALFAGAAGMSGCGLGDGTGTITGMIFVEGCTFDTSLGSPSAPVSINLNPEFFVADMVRDLPRIHMQNRLQVRVQSGGNFLEQADALFLSATDSSLVAADVGQPITVGPTTNLRATLALQRTCPSYPSRLELDGQITFSSFGAAQAGVPNNDFIIKYDDVLTASFDFTIVDRRASTLGGIGSVPVEPTVGGTLNGDFSFEVRPGRAAQAYP